jgi:hypothetical protein
MAVDKNPKKPATPKPAKPAKQAKPAKPAPLGTTEIADVDLEKVSGGGTSTCGCSGCSVPIKRR